MLNIRAGQIYIIGSDSIAQNLHSSLIKKSKEHAHGVEWYSTTTIYDESDETLRPSLKLFNKHPSFGKSIKSQSFVFISVDHHGHDGGQEKTNLEFVLSDIAS